MTCERCGETSEALVRVTDWNGYHYYVCASCYEYLSELYGASKVNPGEMEYDRHEDEGFPWEDEYMRGEKVRELCFE